VNWGAITDAGYLARNRDTVRIVAARGIEGITVKAAFDAMLALIHGDNAQVGVVKVDWPQFFSHDGANLQAEQAKGTQTTILPQPADPAKPQVTVLATSSEAVPGSGR
jgi:hypothetical protein